MSDDVLTKIAHHLLALFLLTLGLQPSEGQNALEIFDIGPHRVFVQRAEVPNVMADNIDRDDVLSRLVDYIGHHNALPRAVKFEPHDLQVYSCCGTFLYASISHTA